MPHNANMQQIATIPYTDSITFIMPQIYNHQYKKFVNWFTFAWSTDVVTYSNGRIVSSLIHKYVGFHQFSASSPFY